MNALMKKGYSANELGSGIVAEQNQGMSGCAGDRGRGLGGGSGKGKGHCGGKGGGGGCGK